MGFDRAQVKRGVRQTMRVTRPRPMLVTLLFMMMASVSTGIINGVLGTVLTGGAGDVSTMLLSYLQMGYELEEAWSRVFLEMVRQGPGFIFGMVVGGTVLSIIVSLWQSLLNVGYSGYALSMSRGESPALEKLFCSFPVVVPVLVTRVLTGVFIVLWSLLLSVCWSVLVFAAVMLSMLIDSEILMGILMLALIIALWVGMACVMLRYALVDYVVLDKGLSGMDAIRENKRLLKGRFKDLFLLQLSFVGWYLLLLLLFYLVVIALAMTFIVYLYSMGSGSGTGVALVLALAALMGGIALLIWLRPYAAGCMARFYDWARGEADGFAGGAGFGPGSGDRAWGQPGDYTWTAGPTSGTGTGSGPSPGNGGSAPLPPRPPRPPKDDPWN